jgi:hypothetical protein
VRGLKIERALRKARNARENLIGGLRPDERPRIRLMGVDGFLNGGLELRHTSVGAAAQLFVRQFGEPPLDETQPRSIGGRKWM